MIMSILLIMSKEYINIYNNFIKLTTNKILYKGINKVDTFSDRMIFFLIHFAFFLKVYKKKDNANLLQEIYDFVFRQLELSIREIGYGDQSINKKMKDYVNLFYSILEKIEIWENLNQFDKLQLLNKYMNIKEDNDLFVSYFDKYRDFLLKNTLKNFTKDILELKF